MASSAMKAPLIKIATRGFAAQVNPIKVVAPSVSTLSNKVTLVSQDNCGGLSRVSIVFKTGSRNETPDNRGAAAVIRSLAGLSTSKYTQFGIVRNLQQLGGSISATGDRETTSFTLLATRDQLESLLPYLSEVACNPAFKPWEVSDSLPLLEYQMALLTPQIRVVDILHKAAYRTGLGNSIFLKKDHLGKQDSETLKHFVSSGFTANRAAVAGVNVDELLLKDFAQSLPLSNGAPAEGNGTYFGGEIRKDKYGNTAQVAIAGEGSGLADQKSAVAFAVLQYALGVAPSVQWGSGASPLAQAVAAATKGDAGASSLNVSYTNSGLFGVVISSSAASAGKAVEAALGVLKGKVTDADVARGKAQLKTRVLDNIDNSGTLVQDMGTEAVLTGAVQNACAVIGAIDNVTTSDVSNALSKVSGSKLSLAGFGNLNNVPYLDQLK